MCVSVLLVVVPRLPPARTPGGSAVSSSLTFVFSLVVVAVQ